MLNARAVAISLIVLLTVGITSSVHAVIINGGFETGDFTGWSTTGNTSIQDSTFGSGPVEGTYDALLTTGSDPDFGDPSVSASDLETFLGLAPGSLNGLGNGDATEGSAIKQTFSAQAGDVLSFDWNFLTSEPDEEVTFNDFAFVSLLSLETLADVASSTFVSSQSILFSLETGFQTFSVVIPADGIYTLGLGVVDVDDDIVDSGLLIDNVKLTSSTPVPEPGTLLLLGSGLLGLGLLNRRRKRT